MRDFIASPLPEASESGAVVFAARDNKRIISKQSVNNSRWVFFIFFYFSTPEIRPSPEPVRPRPIINQVGLTRRVKRLPFLLRPSKMELLVEVRKKNRLAVFEELILVIEL